MASVFPSYFIPTKVGIKSCRHATECFTCTCIWLHVFELTVAIQCWPAIYLKLAALAIYYCGPYFIAFSIRTSCNDFIV